MANAKRYTVTATDFGCTLKLSGDYGRDYESSEHEFASVGGAIFETTSAPGSSGRQVCATLFGLGSCAYADDVAPMIRAMARRHCDAIDRAAVAS